MRSPVVRIVVGTVLGLGLLLSAHPVSAAEHRSPRDTRALNPPDASAIRLPRVVSGQAFTARVPIANDTTETWSSWSERPVRLSYHWLDASGHASIWDGLRTPLPGELAAGDAATVDAIVEPPHRPGEYTLVFDLVRESIGWLARPIPVSATVEAAVFRAAIAAHDAPYALVGSKREVELSVTNTGNVTWRGSSAPQLSYHWYDEAGRALLVWDGERTALPVEVPPGATRTVALTVAMPRRAGVYTLRPDLVREGIGWFSGGTPSAALNIRATTDLNADWERTSTPDAIAPGTRVPMDVVVRNVGLRTWSAHGATPARLSYHWYDASGRAVQWDGARFGLTRDVPPGEQVSAIVEVSAPDAPGAYDIAWDVVQEGVGWASTQSGVLPRDRIVVKQGVTFYGKGWGHGVGLSQWGAQGWAEGAVGSPLTGEDIVAKYYPDATIATLPSDARPIRVLLSQPSTACVERSISTVAHVRAPDGIHVQRDGATIFISAPGETLRVRATWSSIVVESNGVIYVGTDRIAMLPVDPTQALTIDEKGLAYRSALAFEPAGYGALRVVNHVGAEDYMRGSLPGEMPSRWHVEALRAQAFAGLSYALWRQSGMGHMPYDLRDDITDQCYGGAGFESARTDAAVASTARRYLAYQGRPIRAYYSASNGGAIETNACVWDVDKERGGLACGTGEPYLRSAPDPADLAATDSKGANPHRLWTETFSAAELRWLAFDESGVDIGDFVSIDLSNRSAAGYVVSVKLTGTRGSVDLRGARFLRGALGLRSSLVRLEPF